MLINGLCLHNQHQTCDNLLSAVAIWIMSAAFKCNLITDWHRHMNFGLTHDSHRFSGILVTDFCKLMEKTIIFLQQMFHAVKKGLVQV